MFEKLEQIDAHGWCRRIALSTRHIGVRSLFQPVDSLVHMYIHVMLMFRVLLAVFVRVVVDLLL